MRKLTSSVASVSTVESAIAGGGNVVQERGVANRQEQRSYSLAVAANNPESAAGRQSPPNTSNASQQNHPISDRRRQTGMHDGRVSNATTTTSRRVQFGHHVRNIDRKQLSSAVWQHRMNEVRRPRTVADDVAAARSSSSFTDGRRASAFE